MAEYEYLNAGNSEAQEKVALSRLFAQVGTLAAPGVLGGLVVSQNATADVNVLIAQGSCVLHPTMTVGASLLVNDTTKTLNVLTANPVGGLPRNDIVVFDSLTAALSVIIGTPNASPTDPTVPNTSLALARLRHGASAVTIPAANIDTLIVTTYLRGVTAPADTGWVNATLASGWSVYSGETPGYRRLNGITHLRGRATSTGVGATAFTLPVGYRPAVQIVAATLNAAGGLVTAQVTTAGSVAGSTAAAVTGFSFGGLKSFPADA